MKWIAFAAAAPELSTLGERRLDQTGLALIGTIRADGSPRISPIEPFFSDGELMLGMMWRSKKALDLLRDPRLTFHTATYDRSGADGDFKLYGTAVDVGDPAMRTRYGDVLEAKIQWRPSEPFHLFAMDIERAGFVRFGKEQVAMRWTPGRGVERIPHPDD
jgi:hypothetical protein